MDCRSTDTYSLLLQLGSTKVRKRRGGSRAFMQRMVASDSPLGIEKDSKLEMNL